METSTVQTFTEGILNDTANLNKTSGQTTSSHGSPSTIYISICLIWVPGFLTNVLALSLIIRDLRKAVFPAIVLLFVLCLSDLTAVTFSISRHMIIMFIPTVTYSSCASLSTILTFFKLYSGVMNCIMAADRVMAICAPFYYKKHVDVTTWKLVCMFAAVATACLNLLPLIGLGNYMGMRRGKQYCTPLSYKTSAHERIYGFMYGVTGMMCVITIACLNAVVIRSVLRLNKRVIEIVPSETTTTTTEGERKTKGNQSSYEIAFAKLMICLACVYMVCGAPYNVLVLIDQLNVHVEGQVRGYIHLLSGFSYTVDPVVYILIRKSNRKRILDFFRRCKGDR